MSDDPVLPPRDADDGIPDSTVAPLIGVPDVRMYRQDRAPWGVIDMLTVLGVIMVAFVGIFTLLSLVLNALGIDSDPTDNPAGARILLLGQMALDLAAVGAAAGFSIAKYRAPWRSWGLVRPLGLRPGPILAVLALSYIVLFSYSGLMQLFGFDTLVPESNVPKELFKDATVIPLTLFLVLVVAPLLEEMFFRGFLFHGLWSAVGTRLLRRGDTSARASQVGGWAAAIISGLFFSTIHVQGLSTIGLVVPFATIGTLFALIVRRTGSLWNAIAVHFLFNLISVIGSFAPTVMR